MPSTRARVSRTLPLALLCTVLSLPGPAAAADRPKAKPISRDGPSGRYLLGGTWYKRSDPLDQGIKAAFHRTASRSGWTRTGVPNAANAADFSPQSYTGTVHWYR